MSLIQKAYYAFTISNELPVNDLKGFVAHAKSKPGALNYGKVGAGSVTELLAKQLERVAGISMTGVTFRGTGPAVPTTQPAWSTPQYPTANSIPNRGKHRTPARLSIWKYSTDATTVSSAACWVVSPSTRRRSSMA